MIPQRLEGDALFLLGRQDYTVNRMGEKLALKYPQKMFDDSETVISSLMENLQSAGYINDDP